MSASLTPLWANSPRTVATVVTVLALLSVDFSLAAILPLWISANIGYSLGLVVSYVVS